MHRGTRTLILAATAVALLSACGGGADGEAADDAGAAEPATTGRAYGDDGTAPDDGEATAGPTDGAVDPAVADAAMLTAVEEATAGGPDAGVVAVAPADLLATADAVCVALDGGASLDDVLTDALSELPGDDADAEAGLAGAVVGASITTHCPTHSELLP